MVVLQKHSSMCNGTIGAISVTGHHIELEEGTQPMRSVPYRFSTSEIPEEIDINSCVV